MTSIYTDRMCLDWDADDPDDMTVAEALDKALNNLAGHAAAVGYLDLPQDDIDYWEDRAEDLLLDTLTKDQLAKAVLRLLVAHAAEEAHQLVHQFRDLPECGARSWRRRSS